MCELRGGGIRSQGLSVCQSVCLYLFLFLFFLVFLFFLRFLLLLFLFLLFFFCVLYVLFVIFAFCFLFFRLCFRFIFFSRFFCFLLFSFVFSVFIKKKVFLYVFFSFFSVFSSFLIFLVVMQTLMYENSTTPRRPHNSDTRPNHTTTGMALLCSLTLETRSHPWVPAGHPQYTGPWFAREAVDGPKPPQPTRKPLRTLTW